MMITELMLVACIMFDFTGNSFFCIQLCLEWCFAHLCQIWCKYLTFAEIECCWFSKWQPFNAHFYVVVVLESGTMRRRAKFCHNILNAGRQIEFKMAAICSVGVLLYVMIFWSLCQILFKYHCWIVGRGIGIIQDVSNFFILNVLCQYGLWGYRFPIPQFSVLHSLALSPLKVTVV